VDWGGLSTSLSRSCKGFPASKFIVLGKAEPAVLYISNDQQPTTKQPTKTVRHRIKMQQNPVLSKFGQKHRCRFNQWTAGTFCLGPVLCSFLCFSVCNNVSEARGRGTRDDFASVVMQGRSGICLCTCEYLRGVLRGRDRCRRRSDE